MVRHNIFYYALQGAVDRRSKFIWEEKQKTNGHMRQCVTISLFQHLAKTEDEYR